MKKKVLSLLVIISFAALAACGTPTTDQPKPTPPVSASGTTPSPTKPAEDTPTQAADTTPATTQTPIPTPENILEESIIYDKNNITVTAKGLEEDSIFGPSIKILIENNSDKNITIQTRNESINGYMASFLFSADIVAGKKSNDTITLFSSDLKRFGIETIADIEFQLHIFCSDDWETIDDSDIISLQTSASKSYTQQYDDTGFIAYEGNGIKIIIKGISENELFGPELITYIENNSDKPITVQVRDTSINGFMVMTSMSADIMPGKKALDEITFFSSDLQENDIDKITEVETSFQIINTENWDTIISTEAIVINFE